MAFSDEMTVAHMHLRALRPGMALTPLQSPATEVSEGQIDHDIKRLLGAIRRADIKARQVQARAALPPIVDQDELSHPARRTAFKDGAASVVTVQGIAWLWPWAIDTETRSDGQRRSSG